MRIVVHEDNTGFAPKAYRFYAIDDDRYDGAEDSSNRSQIGYGRTKEEAIADLLDQLEDAASVLASSTVDAGGSGVSRVHAPVSES